MGQVEMPGVINCGAKLVVGGAGHFAHPSGRGAAGDLIERPPCPPPPPPCASPPLSKPLSLGFRCFSDHCVCGRAEEIVAVRDVA